MKQAHICLDETLGIRYAILPGDPARLDRIAKELEDVQELAYNREFRSLRGRYKGVDVLALSTGIGGAAPPGSQSKSSTTSACRRRFASARAARCKRVSGSESSFSSPARCGTTARRRPMCPQFTRQSQILRCMAAA